MEKFLEINTFSLAVFGMSIFGILKYFFEKFKKSLDLDKRERENLNSAMLAVLHNKIFKNGCDYIRKGRITVAELNDLEKMFKPYEAMGGNSTAKIVMENVRKLPIKNETIEFIKGDDVDG